MIQDFHFLRPWLLLVLVPFIVIFWKLWRKKISQDTWQKVCDPHLLPYLIDYKSGSSRAAAYLCMLLASIFISLALAGPAWQRLPVPAYQSNLPRVVVLDMSQAMLEKDLTPDRLSRAKFKLHDLFKQKGLGQLALIVYTEEPFVVSPLTEDANTIDALIDMLLPDIMPVGGQNLSKALKEAAKLIKQAGFSKGEILVLTASPPSEDAITEAKSLSAEGFNTSIMPVLADQSLSSLFKPLAQAGKGSVLAFTDKEKDLKNWLSDKGPAATLLKQTQNEVPIWRDEGRWFIVPVLVFLMPVFRRLWLQRIA